MFSTTFRRRAVGARRSGAGSGLAAGALALGLIVALFAAPAVAETTTERSASILIFPKIVYDGSRDTFIQISNTSNSMVHAHCFYVDATPECLGEGDCLSGTCTGPCRERWQEVDFSIWLTKQQPTHWAVGFGRIPDPFDPMCSANPPVNYDCDGAGLDPGRIPPVSSIPFQGELRCIEVDQSGAPISGNHLKGEATIVRTDGDAAKYNAIGLLGEPFSNNGDNILCIGGGVSDECPSGAEYEGCAQRLLLNHFAQGADDLLFGPTSTVSTEVTLVPCTVDYERQAPVDITVQFLAFNEFENRLSTNLKVNCWRTFSLSDQDLQGVLTIQSLGTRFAMTTMRYASPTNGPPHAGIMGIVEEYHRLGDQTTRAAFNLHEQGTRPFSDLMYLPEGP